ncbi:MAG: sodium:solute symporter [Hyphomicrobiaceae bacterium]|nr:sodium:solute symporter [Hyphomicrobiaceae bacterium]MCC0023633.1 sodium:solute symporter [Hyphomicrobiaceae bacterium]
MISGNLVILTAFAYIVVLFGLAYFSDQRARRGRNGFLRSPLIYTLAISVYCTSWTFYGAVGSAANNGLEFLAVYIGPTLVFVGWWFGLRKLVRISHSQRITSVADFISSRFGKSGAIAVLVTLIAVLAATPYIALQLKAITSSLRVMLASDSGSFAANLDDSSLALVTAAIMALFTILFGTRNVDANEQHHGVVAAIAFEAVIKLAALFAVGLFVVFGLGGGLTGTFERAAEAGVTFVSDRDFGSRWITITLLSAAAIVCLPRQFQITVVENADESHLRTASWAFPLYMLGMSLFTVPIAVMGKALFASGADPDMFVLTLPLSANQQVLSLFAFIGGFSSATSMIIVSSIALSIMVSNHIVVPVALRSQGFNANSRPEGVTRLLLTSRRIAIVTILFLGFTYFWLTNGSGALAIIGLISFTGVAQFLPAILAALFWRDATRQGALAGLIVGFAVWVYCLFLPAFAPGNVILTDWVNNGLFGWAWLKPQALFGIEGIDPLVHAVMWSLMGNSMALIGVSIATENDPVGRLQAARFVDAFRLGSSNQSSYIRSSATLNDLFRVASRVLGYQRATQVFDQYEADRRDRETAEPSPAFIADLESELAGSIGAASAHVILSQVVSGDTDAIEEVIRMADETQQILEYSQRLENTTTELQSTAEQLRTANAQLRQLDQQKDEFLSQVSHEVRTPMTAIRSFSEILLTHKDLSSDQRQQFVTTIHSESMRLTALLDEILDLSALERGESLWTDTDTDIGAALQRAVDVCTPIAQERNFTIISESVPRDRIVFANSDRLSQVFINLITNAIKYNDSDAPFIRITCSESDGHIAIDFTDNGPGVAPVDRDIIFEKFARGRGEGDMSESGSGLGLAISREIINRLAGRLELVPAGETGACFRVTLPLRAEQQAAQ